MKVSTEKLSQLIDYLQGTCMSLHDGCEKLGFDQDDLTIEQLVELDNAIFECECCGWWYEVGQQSREVEEANVCEDCEDEYLERTKMISDIGQLIDSNIIDFIDYTNTLNFSECVGIKTLLEAELHRSLLAREKCLKEMEHGFDRVSDYVSTFVIERQILDRIEITEAIKSSKGVDLSIFTPTVVN